jgi:hypothetical protein
MDAPHSSAALRQDWGCLIEVERLGAARKGIYWTRARGAGCSPPVAPDACPRRQRPPASFSQLRPQGGRPSCARSFSKARQGSSAPGAGASFGLPNMLVSVRVGPAASAAAVRGPCEFFPPTTQAVGLAVSLQLLAGHMGIGSPQGGGGHRSGRLALGRPRQLCSSAADALLLQRPATAPEKPRLTTTRRPPRRPTAAAAAPRQRRAPRA